MAADVEDPAPGARLSPELPRVFEAGGGLSHRVPRSCRGRLRWAVKRGLSFVGPSTAPLSLADRAWLSPAIWWRLDVRS